MADRNIVVRLRAEAAQFRSEMNAAAKSAADTGAAAQSAGKQVQSSAEQIERSSKRVTEARRQELEAAARLGTAEKRLDEVKRNNRATASQVAAAEERSLTARNRLEKATERLSAAERDHAKAMQVSAQNSQAATSKLRGLAQQADANREAWTTAGTAMTLVGGAIVGIGVAAMRTGVQYNTLQQTSRAAMKTLMGGAEQANRQMDKLDAFAKKSPFAKQVFIQAQQQLIGFGVEAKKVIPYLGAIQDAVAATGGGNQQIKEIVETMSKIQSASKITGQDLIEFGNRGIDAAGLIGSQMGKTGAQIREDITAGTLGAEEALDALTKGMSAKFGGAAADVKNTFDGAMDRVKSAWRDLSASLAEPLVGKNGGGLGVAALNGLADALRDFESLPAPVRNTGLALSGLAGAASLAAGGFLLLMPKIVEIQGAFQQLSGQSGLIGSTTRGLGKLGPALATIGKVAGVAAAGYVSLSIAAKLADSAMSQVESTAEASKFQNLIVGTGKAEDALKNIDKGFKDVSVAGNDSFTAVDSFGSALKRIFDSTLNDKINTGLSNIFGVDSGADKARKAIGELDTALVELANSGAPEKAQAAFSGMWKEAQNQGVAFEDLLSVIPQYRDYLIDLATNAKMGSDEQTLMAIATGKVTPEMLAQAEAAGGSAEAIAGVSEASKAAAEELEKARQATIASADGFLDFATKAKDAKVSTEEWIADLEKQIGAQQRWVANLEELKERGASQQLLDELIALGRDGAARVEELASGSQESIDRLNGVFQSGTKNANDLANGINSIPDADVNADTTDLETKLADAKDRLDRLGKMKPTPYVKAETKKAKEEIADLERKIQGIKNKTVTIDLAATGMGWNLLSKEGQDKARRQTRIDLGLEKPRPGAGEGYGVLKRADGGPISGPGTGTSDSIPTMLSNGEHVWTAFEVQRAGGHGAIESMRRAVVSGQRLAKGGAVGAAERRVDAANADLRAARRAKSDAKGQRRLADATRRLRQAEDEVDAAKRSLKAAKDRAKADEKSAKLAEQRARDERERQARVGSLQSDLRTDLRRGSIRDQVTGGLSGGYSAVDRLYDLGANQDLSRGSRSRANSSARKFEANLRNLYGQAEKIDAKLKSAQDKAQELKGINDSVVNSLLGGRDLDVGTFSTNVGGNWVTGSNLGQATKSMRADAAAMKAFAGKLKKLVELGVPGAIVQEIAQAGVVEGSNMADGFLDATAAERKSYLGAWKEYEKYANQAGQYVTEGFYKGGSAAADGVVKGLEGKKKNVETEIANLAKVMESTFKSVLGIRSPSRVMAELGGFTAEGLVQGMLGGVTDVQSAAAMLGAAAVPSDMSFAVSATPVVADDEGQAGLAMQDMSTTTLDAMSQMQTAVSEGFAGMVANVQAAQAGMLADTQTNQTGMLTATQTSNANMLVNTQTQQEAMRLAVATKQLEARTAATTEQEAMRLMLLDKQSQMKTQSATDFESMRATTSTKLGDMRRGADTTMLGMHGDQISRLDSMKSTNKAGFESMLRTSNANMRAIRSGMDSEMSGARPELGNNLNKLISVFASFTASVNKAFKDVGVKLDAPAPLKLATGGRVRGPGSGTSDDVPAWLSNGEFVVNERATRQYLPLLHAINGPQGAGAQDFYRQADGFLDGPMLARGGVVMFAGGGTLMDAADWWIAKGAKPSRHSRFNGGRRITSGHSRNSLHYQDRAVDLNFAAGTSAYEQGKFDQYLPAFKQAFPRIRTIWRAPGHYNHLHIDTGRGGDIGNFTPGSGGGGAFMPPSHPFLDKAGVSAGADLQKAYAQAAEKITSGIYAKHAGLLPGGMLGQLGKGIMSQVSEGLVGKAKEYGKSQTFVDPGGSGVERWRDTVIQALTRVGLPTSDDYVNAWLRQIKTESGGNPRAVQGNIGDVNNRSGDLAHGLVQVIGQTFAAFRDKSLPNDRFNPLANLVAGMNWAKYKASRKGTSMLSFIGKGHGYEDGTKNAKRGLAIVGESGPELVNFQGGEQVLSNPESMRFMAANRTYVPTQGGMQFDQAAFTRAVADAVTANGVSPESIAAAMNGVRFTLKAGQHEFDAAVVTAVGTGYDQSVSRRSKSSQKIGAI